MINDLLQSCFGNGKRCGLVLGIKEMHQTVVMEMFCTFCKCQLYENKKQAEKVENYFLHCSISKEYIDSPCEITDKKSKPGIANCWVWSVVNVKKESKHKRHQLNHHELLLLLSSFSKLFLFIILV